MAGGVRGVEYQRSARVAPGEPELAHAHEEKDVVVDGEADLEGEGGGRAEKEELAITSQAVETATKDVVDVHEVNETVAEGERLRGEMRPSEMQPALRPAAGRLAIVRAGGGALRPW